MSSNELNESIKRKIRKEVNLFSLTDDMFHLYNAMKLSEKLLDNNEFPIQRLEKYKKNGGAL